MPEIIPAILPKSTDDLKMKIAALSPSINFIHLDVLERDVWRDSGIDFEAHIMVKDPLAIVSRWVERGAKRIIIHNQVEEVLKARLRVEVGLGVELQVPLGNIFPLVEKVDFVHLMSIDALGTQGDDFEPVIFDRIKKLKGKFPKAVVSIDGGVNQDNADLLFSAGADRLIVGSAFQKLWSSRMKE